MLPIMMLVFVYGTLKQNQPNHYWLTKSENGISKFLSNGKTMDRYPLVIGTRYNIPFILNMPGIGYEIDGEIYEIDEHMLKKLDELEGHPIYYLRQQININGSNGTVYNCWTYFLKSPPQDFLNDRPLINSYANNFNQSYIPPSERVGNIKAMDDLDYRHN